MQWVGCVDCSPSINVPPAPKGLCDPVAARGDAAGMYERPAGLDTDYGVPQGMCAEAARGVFVRQWSKAKVTFDCADWTAKIEPGSST